MRLGNSSGNNIGKKYLDRQNLDHDALTGSDYARLDEFNTWYTDHVDRLEQELKNKNIFDDDIFSDTYVRMCENILFGKSEIKCYKSYFCRAYFTNRIQVSMKEKRYYLQANDYEMDAKMPNNDAEEHVIAEKANLIEDTLAFVKRNYNELEYTIFYNYMNLEDRNYDNMVALTGQKKHKIQRVVSNIKKGVQANMELVNRRRVLS